MAHATDSHHDLDTAAAATLVAARGLGIEFVLDRHQRPVTPALARLRRSAERVWALRDVDLTFLPGESVALVGRSGSGKTTFLRGIAGVVCRTRATSRSAAASARCSRSTPAS